MMPKLPNSNLAYHMLLQEQTQKELSQNNDNLVSSKALAFAPDRRRYPKNGFNSDYQRNNASGQSSNVKRYNFLFCDYCKSNGHIKDKCYKLHGYPQGHKYGRRSASNVHSHGPMDNTIHFDLDSIGMSRDQFQSLLSFLEKQRNPKVDFELQEEPTNQASASHLAGTFCFFFSKITSSEWIIDSGAMDHICTNHSLFVNLRKVEGIKHHRTVPDGRKVKVTSIGDIQLTKDILLHNALYVPDFQFSLICVPKLCLDLNVSLMFSTNKCVIRGPSMKETIVLGSLSHGLFYADTQRKKA